MFGFFIISKSPFILSLEYKSIDGLHFFQQDYILSLLSGYVEPEDVPAGVEVPDGGHYNPYFLGSVIAMAPPLYNNVRK